MADGNRFFVLPIIPREQYDAFRRDIGPNLADTYDEWTQLFADEIAEAERQRKTIIRIETKHDEFMAFCSATGQKANPQTLLNFAIKKSGRQ